MSRAETGTSPQGTQYPTTTLLLVARFVKGAAVAIATTAAATERMENFIGEERRRLLFRAERGVRMRELKNNKKAREGVTFLFTQKRQLDLAVEPLLSRREVEPAPTGKSHNCNLDRKKGYDSGEGKGREKGKLSLFLSSIFTLNPLSIRSSVVFTLHPMYTTCVCNISH